MRRFFFFTAFLALCGGTALAAQFEHAAHLDYAPDSPCAACHVADSASIKPAPAVCKECHEDSFIQEVTFPGLKTHGPTWALNHRAAAKGNVYDCATCHAQSDCLDCHKAGFADEQGAFGNSLNNVHRSDFHVTHPLTARGNQQLCASCHSEKKFCNDCHDTFRMSRGNIGSPSHRYTFDLGMNGDIDAIHAGFDATKNCDNCHQSGIVAPSFHEWQIDHAREARRGLATCQACHPEGDVCLKCHSAKGGAVGFNPHPKDWDDMKNRLNDASKGRTCRKCH